MKTGSAYFQYMKELVAFIDKFGLWNDIISITSADMGAEGYFIVYKMML